MRTTVTLDDDVATALKKRADSTGQSLEKIVNSILRRVLEAEIEPTPARRACSYRLETASLGRMPGEMDPDRAVGIAAELEDAEITSKLGLKE